MPPSSQQREGSNMKEMTKEQAAAMNHLGAFVNALAELSNAFIKPMNPAESAEVEAYVRRVLAAIDEVVLIATMQENEEDSRKALAAATELQIAGLFHLHTKGETKH